jgi:tetratricopeptide (TPR) repeat protein
MLDSVLAKLPFEKNDSTRFYLAFSALTESEINPVDDMGNADAILVYGQRHKDNVCQVMGLACLGYDYRAFGNTAKSLEYSLKSMEVAEASKDNRLIAPSLWLLAADYADLGDYAKAKSYGLQSLERGTRTEQNLFTIISLATMSEIYLATGSVDSALICAQRAYEISMSTGIKDYIGGIYEQLGTIQSRLNNPTLALSYLNLALAAGTGSNSPKFMCLANSAIANFYLNNNQKDSAVFYAKQAIGAVRQTPFSTMSLKPAKMLLDLYKNTNVDSAFKYSELYRISNDSLYNFKTIQQTQIMTFEEDARQKERAVEQAREEEERYQNIQYALIAIGIIVFIIFFLLFSHSVVANEKFISFFATLGLLVVFEFINLLIHPWLARITNDSPVLMLLALVAIAALLIPLHHRLEHWIKGKMVEKNKAIRLAAAKKTIEELEANAR